MKSLYLECVDYPGVEYPKNMDSLFILFPPLQHMCLDLNRQRLAELDPPVLSGSLLLTLRAYGHRPQMDGPNDFGYNRRLGGKKGADKRQ